MSTAKPVFLEYNPEEKKQELYTLFETETNKALSPAQNETILLNILEYKASLLVNAFNEAAANNLVQFSKPPFLDFIGDFTNTTRLSGNSGEDVLKIELFESFTNAVTIPKGTEVLTKDEKYTFATKSNLTIAAGETIGYVTIVSNDLTSAVNAYGAGDINILLKPLSYIKSVTNQNGVTGGEDEEADEDYIKRILLAPESFSCAGSRKSYIYHTLAAHASIIDAEAEAPQIPATITLADTTATENSGTITGNGYSATVNYKTGTCTLTIGENVYTITIPPQNTVYVYPLTDEDTTSQTILTAVDNKFNGEEINPMCDKVIAVAPTKTEKAITVNVVIDSSADYTITNGLINAAANEYTQSIRRKLKAEIVPSQIVTKIGKIEGVYSVDCGSLASVTADANEFFAINLTLNITQRGGFSVG